MSYGGFFNLRKNVAIAYDREFGKHYASLLHCHTKEDYAEFERKANHILEDPRFKQEDKDLLDFLFAEDAGGKTGYRTCGKIRDLLKARSDLDGKRFQYVTSSNGRDYEEFIEFLGKCYSKRKNMVWY